MTVIKLKGGLGNQMFQYAYGRSLELAGKNIIFDTSFFNGGRLKTDTPRDFSLGIFNLQTKVEFLPQPHLFRDFIIKLKRKLGFQIDEYFQNEKYFKDISEEIRHEFTLKDTLLPDARNFLEQIIALNSVSLHVRRGDYINDKKTNEYHGVCRQEYYESAMKMIQEKVPDVKYFVFSDDIEWTKKIFVGDKFVFVSSPNITGHEEMFLMSKCKHNIIANSSFSWWGAWLNENPKKIVIAPKTWFNDPKADENHSLPVNWIRI